MTTPPIGVHPLVPQHMCEIRTDELCIIAARTHRGGQKHVDFAMNHYSDENVKIAVSMLQLAIENDLDTGAPK